MIQSPTAQRSTKRTGWIIGIVAVIVALGVGTVGGYFLFLTHPTALLTLRNQSKAYILHGHVPAATKMAQDKGEYSSNQPMQLSISLPLSYQKKLALQAKLALLYDPASPEYHQFLTPEEYQAQFGLQPDTINKVKAYIDSLNGLKVDSISQTGQLINVSGSVPAVESAFGVKIHQYALTLNGKTTTAFAPVNDPQIPAGLSGLIQNIGGLDSFSVPQAPQPRASSNSGYSAKQLQQAYDASGLISKGIDGNGQSIAFLELDGYNAQDIQDYQQQNNVTGGSFDTVSVDGANYDSNPGQGSIEVELDMEVAFGIAPKVHEYVYEGQNSGQGINDVYSAIVNDSTRHPKIVSISWGLCEAQTGSAELQTLDQIFQQGASEGISFFAAAGDSGAYDCGDTNLGVDSPADDPNVTGVGGTHLTLGSNGGYGSETAWSCTSAKCTSKNPQGEGGGGGISQQFQTPDFQKNVKPSEAQGQSGRYVPDVSANADPATGYAIVCTVSAAGCDSSQGPIVVGGTSAAAPLWAAGAALMTQSLGKPLGNINSVLYGANGKGFHDVTQGDNLNYHATQGFDLATGWGSPDFAQLAPALNNPGAGGTGGTGGNPNPTPTPNPGGPTATPNPGGGSNPTPTPGPTGTGQELLTNNGFENGQDPWAEASQGGYQLITTDKPHSGQYSAYLCGYTNCQDEIAQGFTVPQGATSITLSYWWQMVTNKTGACADHLTVGIYSVDASGNLGSQVAQVQDACNTDANNKYEQKTVDLSSALQNSADGQTELAVVFSGTTDGSSSKTGIYVDDVSLQAQ